MYKRLIDMLENNLISKSSINDVEKLADRVLEDGHCDEIMGPTPIVKIAELFGFTTFQEHNMPENTSGNIFVGGTTKQIYGTDKAIVVGDTEEYYHQRFIIAHELAHYLIDYLGSDASHNKNVLFSRAYTKQDHDFQDEILADRFAAELLMPTKLFSRQYVKAMEMSGYNIRYTVTYLSDFFRTKQSSIKRRINEVFY